MLSLTVIICTGILFLLLLISLGFQPKMTARVTGWMIFLVACAGACIYGYGYSVIFPSFPQAVMRAVFSVFGMFLGRNEISAISAAPAFQSPAAQVFLYFVHLMALYCTAGAVIAAIGTRALRLLNLALIGRRDMNIIFGANEESLKLAEGIGAQRHTIVFVDSGSGSEYDARILNMGSLLLGDASSRNADSAFLQKTGIRAGMNSLTVYCLDKDPAENIRFAGNLKNSLAERGVPAEKTRISIITENEYDGYILQKDAGQYGFGSVFALNRSEFLTRLMIREYPPYKTMSFDDKGRAAENFEAIIIGFGSLGQAALRSLVMNGQFCGSTFHAAVVADSYNERSGSFMFRYPGIAEACNVEFIQNNARSLEFYRYLNSVKHTLNYIAVCTGDDRENAEIASELTGFLADAGSHAVIVQCGHEGISRLSSETRLTETVRLCTPDILDSDRIDRMAMVINQQYHAANGKSAEENWKECDYFSRMSCRANADYIPAFLYACGVTEEDVLAGKWTPDEEQTDILSRMEHLRWCAFHYCMGYSRMPEDVFDARIQQYLAEMSENGSSRIRLTRDEKNRLHACLVDWDELDVLAAHEASLTGVLKDYKNMDTDNIRMIPDMLKEVNNEQPE